MKKIVSLMLALMLASSFMVSMTACDYLTSLLGSESQSSVSDSNSESEKTDSSSSTSIENNENLSSVNVIMINDNHGVLNEGTEGMNRIAAGINHYASLGEVVKIANGDMFQGTYVSSTLRGLPMLDALNTLGFDAFVMGNHEFDWGLDEMEKYKDGDVSNGEADFPFLGANIYEKSTGQMVDWLEPYTIVELDEVKIGVIGIIGDVETSILLSNVEAYDFVDPRDIVKDYAAELRTEKGCDAVIVAIHGDDDGLNAEMATYSGDSTIDAILTGHSHIPTDEEIKRVNGKNVCVLQNGGYGDSFAMLTLDFDQNGNLKDTDGKLMDTAKFNDDGTLSAVFAKYEEQMAKGETVLLTSDTDVSRYDLGISVAYSMYIKYGTDFAVINSGGVRTSVKAGEVTYADIFQVLPFENEVYIVSLSGEQLKSYINNPGTGIYYWGIDINSLEDVKAYQLAIVDYVYLSYTFDDYRNDSCIDTNDLIRDVFIEHITAD